MNQRTPFFGISRLPAAMDICIEQPEKKPQEGKLRFLMGERKRGISFRTYYEQRRSGLN